MSKNAHYTEIDHPIKSLYPVCVAYPVSKALCQTDETDYMDR